MATNIPNVPTYSGEVPLIGQGEVEFSQNAQDSLQFQADLPPNINTTVDAINTVATEIEAESQTAQDAALAAESNANFKGNWSNLTGALSIPASVRHNGDTWQLLVDLADVTASEPGVTSDWQNLNDYGTTSNGVTVKHRRGTNAEILAGTPAIGELWFNTTDNSIHMGDGATQGGIKHVNTRIGDKRYGVTFSSLQDMMSGTASDGSTVDWSKLVGVRARWHGYYTQSDGGSNWGIVKAGTITDDGGSLLQVAAGYYVEANLKRSVSVKKFGCKVNANFDSIGHGTPTGDDDYDQFYKCLTFTVQNGLKCKLVAGNMLIGSTIDVDTLPYGDYKGLHIEGTKVKTGRTYTSQIKGAQGLTNLFTQAFDASLTKQRPITLTGFGVISEDEWQDLTVRAPLRAFDLFSCPQSHFERLHFFGITSGLRTRACWLSTYKDVTSNRCSEGIFCDGDDGAGGYGFADHCSFKNITNSGWVSTFGLKLRGCKAPTLDRIDGESGHTGPSLVLEGCHNVDFRGGYYESFVSVTPIEVKPITGTDFKDLTDFSTSVSIANVHGLTNKAGLVKIFKGCIGVDFKNIRNHRFDADGREDEAGEWLTLSAGSASQGFANYLQNISIDGAISDSDNVSTITNLTAHSQMFAYNGEVIQRETNRLFYGLTLKRGMTLINVANNTVEKVIDGGTLNVALSITADSTAGSRVLTNVSSFTGLYVGTFVSFNGQDRLKVTSLDEVEGKIYLGEEISASVVGSALTYTAPTLVSMTINP